MDRLLKLSIDSLAWKGKGFEWPFDGSTTETIFGKTFSATQGSSDRLMDRLLKLCRYLSQLAY